MGIFSYAIHKTKYSTDIWLYKD